MTRARSAKESRIKGVDALDVEIREDGWYRMYENTAAKIRKKQLPRKVTGNFDNRAFSHALSRG